MQSRLAKILIPFILFANLAWAADMDEAGSASGTEEVQTSLNVMDGSGDRAGDDNLQGAKMVFCDHCCHGGLHYLGLPAGVSHLFPDRVSSLPLAVTAGYRSRDLEPPLPPPNI